MEEVEELHRGIPSNDLSEVNDFSPCLESLDGIDKKINDSQQKRRDDVTRRLESLEMVRPEDKERIKTAIEENSYQVAEDYIERVERNESLPDELQLDHAFDRFFPNFVDEYNEMLTADAVLELTADAVLNRIRSSLKNVHAGTVGEGANLVEAWSQLYDSSDIANALKNFMGVLGFTDVNISTKGQTSTGEAEFHLRTTPIADRNITQLPDFGSRADGHYRLVLIRNRVTEEAIVQAAEAWNAGGGPTFVLFLNVLTVEERRKLARDLSSGTVSYTHLTLPTKRIV